MLGRTKGGHNASVDKTSGVFNKYRHPLRPYHFLHSAIDSHSRPIYSEMLADQRKETAAPSGTAPNTCFNQCGISVRKVLTDNGC